MEGISLNPVSTSSHSVIDDGDKARSDADRTTKKVHFKEGNGEQDTDMVVDSGSSPMISWKDKLLGVNPGAIDNEKLESPSAVTDVDLEFFEADIRRSIVNGIPAIDFSERIQKSSSKRWNSRNGGTIGKVVRLDFNTDNRTRGRFARMAVYINLNKPLIAQLLVNGRIQRVEYEALPTICFTCGKYGHTKEICGLMKPIFGPEKVQTDGTSTEKGEEGELMTYGP
ncbi:hypothetical protein PVK06_033803 [Gossypium arboreum]|uniref:CCHC-type domain-containing protein n=1 Tax=Gossypium arboreum TaxID=29729 RepID=A0ABR0NCF4_GOSAR|nr:hypothetical protein PVK06_033803 [Gossypium arboreum]